MCLRSRYGSGRNRVPIAEEGKNGWKLQAPEQQFAPPYTRLLARGGRITISESAVQMEIRFLKSHNNPPRSLAVGVAAIPPSCQKRPPDATILAATWSFVSSRMIWHRSVPANSPPPFA